MSEGLDAVVPCCREKRPEDRYASARELGDDLRRLAAGASVAKPARRQARTLAVLPFRDTTPGPSGFADALGEALTAWLACCDGLRVVSRTSALRFRGSDRPLREIARELGADAVVEGSTWEVNGRVRVTATLIDAAREEHLWVGRFEHELTDVLVVQDELVEAIGRAVRERLDPEHAGPGRGAEPDPAAKAAYLRGRRQWNKRTREGIELAIRHFEEAIDHDPTHAPSFSGLADCYAILAPWLPPRLGYQKAKAAARRALELNPALAEAHTSLAFAQLFGDWDWTASEAGFRRAIALDPGYATGHQWYAEYLTALGRFDEALVEARAAAVLLQDDDPRIRTGLACALVLAGRSNEAREELAKLAAMRTARHVPSYALAGPLALAGDLDAAFAKLEEAFVTRDRAMVWLRVNPRFDPLRGDARYDALVERMRFPS